ncbi:MAG TPA: hypothetical protein VLM38_12085 [Blastocatellia bacterium]|nr:hypothetical protein [Blastocatellia bacterium]
MTFDVEKLYSLLPAVYRIRDIELAGRIEGLLDPDEQQELESLRSLSTISAKQEKRLEELEQKRQRGPLKALLSIIAEQAAVLEENLDQLHDDLFIETCAEWVVPYIGDLVGARGVFVFPGAKFTQRAFVANTLAYRRRKGTAAVLEQLARDVTDWPARAVEYFQLLATTQYMNHIRPESRSFADTGDSEALEAINTPFDRITRTADVRRIEPRRGKYNIPNIGIFLFRIGAFPLTESPAYRLDGHRWLFDALGKDTQLFNKPEPEVEISHLAEPINVPIALSRRTVDRGKEDYYGADRSFSLTVDAKPVTADEIIICNLSDNGAGWAHTPLDKVAVDPVLGRIAFPIHSPPQPPPSSVLVSYHYGFSAEMGGGQYPRATTFVGGENPIVVPDEQSTIQLALNDVAASGGVVEVKSNDYFFETPEIAAGTAGGELIELRADEDHRPVLVLGGASSLSIAGGDEAEVTLNGLLIVGGNLRVPLTQPNGKPNGLRLLRLRHCTLVPGPIPGINQIPAQSAAARVLIELPDTIVEIDSCIVGPIRAIDGAQVRIKDSIIDAGDQTEPAYSGLAASDAGATLRVQNTTIIGRVRTLMMELASNTIFLAESKPNDSETAPVRAERLQQGCVRFSFVPPGSQLPRLFQCQPATASDAARVRPVFTSLRYGNAGYCQLDRRCAVEIREGADDRAEMGAFHDLYQPQREANLRTCLDQYLRFGLEAGIFFAS